MKKRDFSLLIPINKHGMKRNGIKKIRQERKEMKERSQSMRKSGRQAALAAAGGRTSIRLSD